VDLTPPWQKVTTTDGTGSGGQGIEGPGATSGAGGAELGGVIDVSPGAGGAPGAIDLPLPRTDGAEGDIDGGFDVPLPSTDVPAEAGGTSMTGGSSGASGTVTTGGRTSIGGTGGTGGVPGSGGERGGTIATGGTTTASGATMIDAGTAVRSDASSSLGGLLVYYTFENANGTFLPDMSGNRNNGTLSTGAVVDGGIAPAGYELCDGRVGKGLNLIRAGSGYVAMPPALFRGLTEITIATWIQVVTATNWQRLFDIGVDAHASRNPATGAKYMNLAPEAGTTKMAFGMTKDGFNSEHTIATTSPSPGTWIHVAVVLASDGSGKLFVDGAPVASNTSLGLRPSDLGAIDYAYIGRSPFSVDPYLDAVIDEFRIYDHALTAAEVMAVRQFTGP